MKKNYEVYLYLPDSSIEAIKKVQAARSRDEAIRIATGEFIRDHCQPVVHWAKAVR